MTTLLVTLHVLVSFIMIGVILLQAGKGAEIGAAFGGSSQTIFGSRGATSFLGKLTVAAATIFMVTSLLLSIISGGGSVARRIPQPPAAESTAPAAEPAPSEQTSPAPVPEQAPAQAPSSPAPSGTP